MNPIRHIFFTLLSALLLFGMAASIPFPAHAQTAGDTPSQEAPENKDGADIFAQTPSGELLVSPTRVVFEGRTRAADIILNNRGNKETTYRLSLVNLHMDADGNYQDETSEASYPTANEIIRFSPRQVTLQPGQTQKVKLMLRKSKGMDAGEYRSHLKLQTLPDPSFGKDVEAQAVDDGEIGIRLIPLFGVSIPVIVRVGDTSATATITDVSVGKNILKATLGRSGNQSLYGDVIVMQGGKMVGALKGVAVFVPNQKRNVKIALDTEASDGLTVIYREPEGSGSKVLAEQKL